MYKGSCPLCNKEYSKERRYSLHHVFPLAWYKNSQLKVEVCSYCHQEFNHHYRMDMRLPWSKSQCVWNWIKFCRSKGKNALETYPNLLEEVVG